VFGLVTNFDSGHFVKNNFFPAPLLDHFFMTIVAEFWKSLLNSSRLAQKHDRIGATKQSPYSYTSCGSSDCLVAPIGSCFCANLEEFNKP
jgi:hypothetical protein